MNEKMDRKIIQIINKNMDVKNSFKCANRKNPSAWLLLL